MVCAFSNDRGRGDDLLRGGVAVGWMLGCRARKGGGGGGGVGGGGGGGDGGGGLVWGAFGLNGELGCCV